jgi:hypothetical protein
MATSTHIGAVALSSLDPTRMSIGLFGPTGSGKTTNSVSFAGGEWGKVLFIIVESGPEGGAGGATSLQYLSDIHPRVKVDDVTTLTARDWEDMQNQFRWIKNNVVKLRESGITTMVIDSGTELTRIIEVGLRSINPKNLKGNTNAKGEEDSAKKNHILELVPDIGGSGGRAFEWFDYNVVHDRFKSVIDVAKQCGFRLVVTFLEGQGYDEKDGSTKMGIGPDATGRLLPSRIPSWFDCFFHCEVNETGEFVWLTANDPKRPGATGPYIAKNRFGKKLRRYEPADGVALLKRLGITAPVAPKAQVKGEVK